MASDFCVVVAYVSSDFCVTTDFESSDFCVAADLEEVAVDEGRRTCGYIDVGAASSLGVARSDSCE
jgi:hypothetical protein